jgi:hypothetical protein
MKFIFSLHILYSFYRLSTRVIYRLSALSKNVKYKFKNYKRWIILFDISCKELHVSQVHQSVVWLITIIKLILKKSMYYYYSYRYSTTSTPSVAIVTTYYTTSTRSFLFFLLFFNPNYCYYSICSKEKLSEKKNSF